jgi:hypothetical protein
VARGAINVQITGDYTDKDIKRAIRDLESLQSQAAPVAKTGNSITSAFKGMALAAGAFVSVSAVKDFMADAISAGSDLQESLSKVDAVFEANADTVVAWSKESSTAFGQSQAQALEAVGTFGNLLRAFGSTADEAQVMSQRMVELAADLASFNNTSVDDALNALRSGLSGETEPLKRFGVAINDARLKTVALERGLYSGKGVLDTYGKSVAAYELILKDTALAQGDFARTSDGLANQQRIITAEFENLKAAIGTGLIEGFGDLSKNGESLTDSMQKLTPTLQGAAKSVGEAVGDYVFLATQIANLVTEIDKLLPKLGDTSETASSGDRALAGLTSGFFRVGGSVAMFADALAMLQEMNPSTTLVDIGGGAWEAGEGIESAAMAAQRAEESLKEMKAAIDAVKGSISAAQAWIDFRNTLADIREDVDKTSRSIRGSGQAARDNQSALLDAFTSAANTAQTWGERTGASADQVDAKFRGLGQKVVNEFVRQGFNRADVETFLGDKGIWTSTIANLSGAVTDESRKLGVNASRGIATGIEQGRSRVATAMSGTVLAAIQAGKDAAEIQSPSKKAANELGLPIAQGIVEGLRAGGDEVRKAMQDQFLTTFTEVKERLKGELQDAKAAFNDYRASVSQAIAGGIDFSAIAPEFDENGQRVGMTFIEALNQQAAQAQQFATKVKELVALGLSQAALTQVLEAGVQAGTNIANELITGGASTIEQTNALVASTQAAADEVGQLAATAFYNTGVKNAQDTYDGFKANFGEGGPARVALEKLMDRLAASLNRTSTITVTTVNRVINEAVGVDGKRAAGGPVMANKAYLVGERGPEVLVMGSQSGMIVPNNELPMASGGYSAGKAAGASPIYLTVNAGMGTQGAEVGRQIVDALKAYERRNGAVYVAA